ncbi:ExeA family protein [Desulfolithobacter sp.]
MYIEHFQLNKSPFQEPPDPEVFFPGAGRDAILESLVTDIESGRLLTRLVGSEGSGKTLICKILATRIGDKVDVVYLDNPVGSFDDLMRVVCYDLGMVPAEDPDRDLIREFRVQLESRNRAGKRVVIIIDEAEKLFLATLERLLKVLCEAEESGVLSILLAGRPGLDINLEQLTVVCSGIDINDRYFLEPLTREETEQYLKFRLQAAGLPDEVQQDIFTEGAVDKIFSAAKGNLRLTNILAEEALQTSCNEKSFLVLLDHVKDGRSGSVKEKQSERNRKKIFLPLSLPPEVFKDRKIVWAAGAALFVLVLLIFLSRGGDDTSLVSMGPEAPGVPSAASEKQIATPEVVDSEKKGGPGQELVAREAGRNSGQGNDRTNQDEMDTGIWPRTDNAQLFLPETAGKQQPEEKTGAPVAGRSGEDLFRERLGATAGWVAGAYRNKYTIQLMMLTSARAEENLEQMLAGDDYYSIKDQLYIVRKKTTPPVLFVFYGTYDTMEQARQARNRMPVFLRKHHPYALSIGDALKKAED